MAAGMDAEVDREAAARKHAGESFADHVMTVMEDNGEHRHIRFARPGEHSWDRWFEIVTWPGRTHVGGDLNDFTFCRSLVLFDRPDINPQHWAEKVVSGSTRSYCKPLLERQVEQAFADALDDGRDESWLAEIREAWSDHVSWVDLSHEWPAQEALQSFKHGGFAFGDAWEWDLKDWDYQFLMTCWAAQKGTALYLAAQPPAVREEGDEHGAA
jgi:hypothetical protein